MPTGDLLAVALLVVDFAVAFVVAGEHAAQHDEIGARAIGLGDVAGDGAAAVGADLAFEPMRRVGAFDDRRELRIADAGHPPVVQTEPGPMPILTMSAPARISASVMSPVTTLPAMITACG